MNVHSLALLTLLLALLAAGLSGYVTWQTWQLKKLKQFFINSDGDGSLEAVLTACAHKIEELDTRSTLTQQDLGQLHNAFSFALQKMSVVRFNSLAEEGGKLSFSAVFLDNTNSGIVFTSMHGREANRIYAKLIVQGASEHPLTLEEERALKMAQSRNN